MAEFTPRKLEEWQKLAGAEARGKALSDLIWTTPEGIPVKPLYTAADLEGLSHLNTLPGFAPYLRGPRATMYVQRPWTLRQYAGMLPEEVETAP